MQERTRRGWVVGGVFGVALLGAWLLAGSGAEQREPEATSQESDERSVSVERAAPPPSAPVPDASTEGVPSRVRKAMTAQRRSLLRVALDRAHTRQAQATKRDQAIPSDDTVADEAPTVLDLQNKTGNNTAWEQRQLAVLNELLGQCYDLARHEDPKLEGTLAVGYTIHAEPDVGGLLDDVNINDEYTTIEQATMLECVRESLYVLELDAPAEGIKIERYVTLHFSPP